MENNLFESRAYKRSRKMYMAQCAFEYFVSILVADAFLAKLLTHIGISDAMVGIISSFITLAFLFQLLSIFLARKVCNIKKTVILIDTLSLLMFLGLYIIPFLPFSLGIKTGLVVISVLFGYICKYLVASIAYKWANSYVEPTRRGRYSAVKEMVSLITGIIFTLGMGALIDYYEAIGNLEGGFLLVSVVFLVLVLCNFISFMGISNQIQEKEDKVHTASVKEILKNTLGNRNFVNVIIMTVLYDIARYLSIGFLGTFKTNDLLLSVGTVQVINMVANLARLGVSLPFGKYSDKHTYAGGLKLAFLIAAVGFGINVFTTNSTWWLIVIFTVVYNVSIAGSNQNSFNITYSYVKEEYFVSALAIKNSIGGIFGFGASLVGSKILSYVQANGNMVFGIPMYGQQLLCAISGVILLITVLFLHFVIGKQKVMVQ